MSSKDSHLVCTCHVTKVSVAYGFLGEPDNRLSILLC